MKSTASRMVPQVAMVIPYFMIMRNLKLSDSTFGLILTYIPFELTLIVWMLKNFFSQIPAEVEEAAELDGLGAWGILFRVAVPLSKSSIGVTGLMAFLFSWNEFMFGLVLTKSTEVRTLPLALNYFTSQFSFNYTAMFAALTMVILPSIVIYVLLQEQVTTSMVAGSVKG